MPADLYNNDSFLIDETSFQQLYETYWEKVYAICYNHIRHVEIAQGMVQDIFRSLWERRDTLEITSHPEKYLARAAKFKVFEHLRNTQTRKEHLENILTTTPTHTCTTEDEVLYNNLKTRIDALIGSLPDKCRRVFRMSREDGLTNREIANILSISERAVEYHVTRALGVLRVELKEDLADI